MSAEYRSDSSEADVLSPERSCGAGINLAHYDSAGLRVHIPAVARCPYLPVIGRSPPGQALSRKRLKNIHPQCSSDSSHEIPDKVVGIRGK